MRRFLSGLLGFLFAIALVWLLVSNQQEAYLSLDPTDIDDPGLAIGPVWVAVHIVVGLLIGFVLGAVGMYGSGAPRRRELRERRREVSRLREELREARQGVYRAEPGQSVELVPIGEARADPALARG